jgi:ribulose-phosphate 3-epimerase
MTVLIAPSLLAADFSCLAAEVRSVEEAGADLLHLDIMDGHFVPNLTFGPPIIKRLAPHCTVPLDAHLMVTDPDSLIPELAEVGVARIAVHVETCAHLHRTLDLVARHDVAPGVAINPATSLHLVDEALHYLDFVLVMSVNPGYGGQSFIPESLDRIRRLRMMAGARPIEVAVDGGVDESNAVDLVRAGATTLVAGSSVFGAADRAQAIARIRHSTEKGEHP